MTINHHKEIPVICYGYYFELSIEGRIVLTLVDYHFERSEIGLHGATSIFSLSEESRILILESPEIEYAIADAGG